ncbi:hypothetical protein, partial [Stenotrophomonas sp. SrG]|uniref:hypothetical protein n=1 Tax=Stenotrophomonas sp. SrG TaxID=3414430 RepID=UPI003CE6EAA6
TVTAGAFSPGHWFQSDLATPSPHSGARHTWDVSTPEGDRLQTSRAGTQRQTADTMRHALGGIDTPYFPPRHARYLRLASPE